MVASSLKIAQCELIRDFEATLKIISFNMPALRNTVWLTFPQQGKAAGRALIRGAVIRPVIITLDDLLRGSGATLRIKPISLFLGVTATRPVAKHLKFI
jgi:hypothetical protein